MVISTLAPNGRLATTGLTVEQAKGLEFVVRLIRSQKVGAIGIQGYAGCGKTFVVTNTLIPKLRLMGLEVVVTAFTNRAVGVVKDYLATAGYAFIRAQTTSSVLGFRELPPVGKKPPRFEKVKPSSLDDVDVVVVDEASMLPPEHFKAFEQEVEMRAALGKPLWVIYVGDPAQLPPIGIAPGRLSPAMELPSGQIARLTTVMRTGGAVLNAATAVRETKPGAAICFKSETSGGSSVVVHGNRQAARRTAKELVDALGSEFRILAWTNQTVDSWNRICRDHDLGANAPSFVVGERLITRAPIWDLDDINDPEASPICPNGNELEVMDARQREVKVIPLDGGSQICWEIVARCAPNQPPIKFYALDQEDITDYQMQLEAWKTEAINSSGLQSKSIWRERYYPSLRLFGHLVGPSYATTVHRAQGGQWDTVLVDLADINRARRANGSEHQRLLYTGVTRAKRALHIMEA